MTKRYYLCYAFDFEELPEDSLIICRTKDLFDDLIYLTAFYDKNRVILVLPTEDFIFKDKIKSDTKNRVLYLDLEDSELMYIRLMQ